jgi:hypothetical protein
MQLQEVIHRFTEGSGSRWLNVILVLFGMIGLAIWYDLVAFRNLSPIEGMDAAQVARNVGKGRGFTTQFVRPLSVHLVRQHRADGGAQLGAHPDLANPPLYPALLSLPLRLVPAAAWDTTKTKDFSWYLPDLVITFTNQALFFLAVLLLFRLARRLLDETAAWVTAVVFAGSDLYWRFTVSGQSTLLLMVLVLAIVEVLVRIEVETRPESTRGPGWFLAMAAFAGALAGLAALTRYSFIFLMVPLLSFYGGLPAQRRTGLLVTSSAMFLAVLAPWLARNFIVSGTLFGTAGFAVFQETALFPGLELERTLNPDFRLITGPDFWHKLVTGVREILEKELPRLGGSWVTALFVAGLLVPIRNTALSRLRGFVVTALLIFTLVQAMGRTGLTKDTPDINSENLVTVFAPLIFLFGVCLFFTLVEQFGVKSSFFRVFAIGLFLALAAAPLLFTLFMPVASAVAYPPYFPPYIQEKAGWVEKEDWLMSDFPWAVAWYGERESVWLSLKYREDVEPKYRNDFYVMNKLGKPIRGLYLSARTMKSLESKSLEAWLRGGEKDWESSVSDWDSFVLLGVLLKHEIPSGFPLRRAPFGLLPEVFLGDSERNSAKPIKGE